MRLHPLVYVLWLPIWLLILALALRLTPDVHPLVVIVFQVSTVILVFIARDAILNALRNPEFWLVLVSLIITFGLLEFTLRILSLPQVQLLLYDNDFINLDEWRFTQHHYLGYTSTPNYTSLDPIEDIFNSYGYRGPEIEPIPPDGTFRIATLGGSTTAGLGRLNWYDTYPAQLETVLHDAYELDNVQVVNAGQGGYSSWESLMNLQFRVLELNPDMIIVYQSINDIQSRIVPPEQYHSDNSGHRQPWDYEEQQRTQNWMLRVPSLLWRLVMTSTGLMQIPDPNLGVYINVPCSAYGATEACLGMSIGDALEANPPIYYQRNLESIVAIAQTHEIEVVLMTFANRDQFDNTSDPLQTAYADHNIIIKQIADDMNVSLFDFAPMMLPDEELWLDSQHMTVEGNRLRAELIAEFLVSEGMLPSD